MSEAAEQRIADLEGVVEAQQRELIGIQEMLAFVLQEVGKDVFIANDTLHKGLPAGTQIKVDDDLKRDGFVFGLVYPDE